MKIKTKCSECGKTIEVHDDKWIVDRYTDKEIEKLRVNIINKCIQANKEKSEVCYRCYFGLKK